MTAIRLVRVRGRRPTQDGREVFSLFPRSGAHYLYALGFAGGVTKIGVTRTPRKRVWQHWEASDRGVVWAHLFRSFLSDQVCLSVEASACRRAAAISTRIRSTETFTGLSREAALRCVREAIAEVA